jgi:hypothetical protein
MNKQQKVYALVLSILSSSFVGALLANKFGYHELALPLAVIAMGMEIIIVLLLWNFKHGTGSKTEATSIAMVMQNRRLA